MKNRPFAVAALAVLCLASSVSAQGNGAVGPSSQSVATDTTPHVSQASLIDRPSEAVRRSAVVPAAPLPSPGEHMGEARAEMLVGVAAIIAGLLIGGNGGSALAIGGAVIGLYGLWNYAR